MSGISGAAMACVWSPPTWPDGASSHDSSAMTRNKTVKLEAVDTGLWPSYVTRNAKETADVSWAVRVAVEIQEIQLTCDLFRFFSTENTSPKTEN